MASTQSSRPALRVQVFYFANSCAESVQAVGILWATFALTHCGSLVGLVNAAAYLPGVIAGVAFHRYADGGDAAALLRRSNWVLVVVSSALAVVWVSTTRVDVTVALFVVAQSVLSVVKLGNKAYMGRFVRDGFDGPDATRVLQRSVSFGLIGGLVGGLLGGLLLEVTTAGWTFVAAAALYLASLTAVRYATGTRAAPAATDCGSTVQSSVRAGGRRFLWLILVFSIPSSGALPYISTLLVPFADVVIPGSGLFYALLTVVVAGGGFAGGMALSANRIGARRVLSVTLPGAGGICVVLGATSWPPLVVILVFAASMAITSHVISMQVWTNQAPAPDEVGKFTVLRNCVAGSAKGVFSLAAGWIVDSGGPAVTWVALGAALGVFAVAWAFVRGRDLDGSGPGRSALR